MILVASGRDAHAPLGRTRGMTHTPKVPALPLVLLSLAAVALALLLGAGPAAAGGYSTTTLDPLAAAPQAGATLRVGYTVKMHGVTPVGVNGSGIAVVGPGGVRTVAPGRPDGPLGHYVADVRKIRGESFDLSRLIEHVLTQLATDIAADANRLWADEWDMDAIVITGGGGAVLAPYLSPLLSGRVLPVDNTRDARLNNVRGFWKLGVQTWGAPVRGRGGAGAGARPGRRQGQRRGPAARDAVLSAWRPRPASGGAGPPEPLSREAVADRALHDLVGVVGAGVGAGPVVAAGRPPVAGRVAAGARRALAEPQAAGRRRDRVGGPAAG